MVAEGFFLFFLPEFIFLSDIIIYVSGLCRGTQIFCNIMWPSSSQSPPPLFKKTCPAMKLAGKYLLEIPFCLFVCFYMLAVSCWDAFYIIIILSAHFPNIESVERITHCNHSRWFADVGLNIVAVKILSVIPLKVGRLKRQLPWTRILCCISIFIFCMTFQEIFSSAVYLAVDGSHPGARAVVLCLKIDVHLDKTQVCFWIMSDIHKWQIFYKFHYFNSLCDFCLIHCERDFHIWFLYSYLIFLSSTLWSGDLILPTSLSD